jgi:hypothetical protein
MLQLDGHEMTYMEEKASRLKEDCKANQKAQLNAFNLNLGRIQDRQDRLTDAYIDRMIDKEVYERRRESLLMEKIEIEERLSEFKVGGGSVQEKMSKFLEQLKSLNLSYENGIPEEKRDLLKIVTSNRKVDGKNVVIELNFPFQAGMKIHTVGIIGTGLELFILTSSLTA